MAGATHIIVDKDLAYKDVKKIVESSASTNAVVVNENFPMDCVMWKTLVNPNQQIYKIRGRHRP